MIREFVASLTVLGMMIAFVFLALVTGAAMAKP